MDIQQNNVAVLHFNLVNQDGSTIFIRKTKLATFNLINPSEVSVPITDIGFDATLNQCWVRVPKASNAATGQYYGVLNIVDDDWGTYTTSKIKVYSVVSDADEDTKSVVFTATCIATQVTNPSGGNSPYYNTTTSTWWQYSDTLKAFEDTGAGNLIQYITKNVQHLKDGTGNGSIVTCLDDEISANNMATGLCSTDFGKNNQNRGESCVALGENNYIAEGVSNATAIAGAQPSAVDVFAIGDKTAGHKNVFTINKFGDISFRPDSSQERTAILQDILDGAIKNVVYDSSNYSLTVTFYSSSENNNKTKTYDLSGLKAVLKDDAVKEISVNQSTAVMTVTTINGGSQQIQLPTGGVKSFVRTFQEASPVCFDAVTDQDGTTKTLFSPALFMKEPQTSLVLDNVYTGNSGGQTEYFKWFYDQFHITDGPSYATNTFFNLPIDFATKPDCTPFVSSHVIVPTLSCVNGALASYLPLAGGTLTGDLMFSDSGTATKGIYGNVGQSDTWRLIGGAPAYDTGWVELATADNGNEPIYVRQYSYDDAAAGTQIYGNFSKIVHSATLLDESGNTSFPGTVTASAFSGNASSATKATQDGSGNVITSTYLPLAGGTLTGDLKFSDSGTATKGIYGTTGTNDTWRIIGGASVQNSGWLELATGDDGTEPIYVRQYLNAGGTGTSPNIYFGKILHTATLLDESGNTSFPGTVTACGDLHCKGDIYYKKSVSTADISSGVLNISSLTKFINISTINGTITSINNTSTEYSAGDEIILYGTFTYDIDGSKITDGALKIVYTGTKFVRLY